MLLRVWVAGLLLLGGAGCATAPSTPEWAGRMWTEKQTFWIGGISSPCRDAASAKTLAQANALNALAEYIGVNIQSQTTVQTSSDRQTLQALYQARTQEVEIHNLKIEKFKTTHTPEGIVGHLLISVEAAEVARAKQAQERAQDLARQEEARKRKLGYFNVSRVKGWPELTAGVERWLREQGYLVGKQGSLVRLEDISLSCRQNALADIQICVLHAGINCRGKRQLFSAQGYGQTARQARQDAIDVWLEKLPQNLVEE